MPEYQEIFVITTHEELEQPTWTVSGECLEKLSTDFIGATSSIESAYQLMKSKKNVISGDGWHFCLTRAYLDDMGSEKEAVIEGKINPATL